MRDRLVAWRWRLDDALWEWSVRWSSVSLRLLCRCLCPFRSVPELETRYLDYLMNAQRARRSTRLTRRVEAELPSLHRHMEQLIEAPWSDRVEEVARRSIVLKKPRRHEGAMEKGVLLVSFTFNFPFFFHHVDCNALLREYHLVLEPSWSDYCQPSLLFWTRFEEPVVVQATEPRDLRFVRELNSSLVAVPFGASDWVDFRVFRPLTDTEKDLDVAFVGSYSRRKRHHVLLAALGRLRREGHRLRAAIVCHTWGDAKEDLPRLARHYGVEEQITWYEDLSPAEVNRVLVRAKCSVLLSRQEGSNRSLFEGFFAGVPGILLRRNIGVNKNYLTPETGLLIEERELPSALLHMRARWRDYRPRQWALQNISPLVTTRKLTAVLRGLDPEVPWTGDLAPKVNRPEVYYFHQEDARRLPTAAEVLRQFLVNRRG